ncbi:hypothetical protein KUTeg_020444 [Tegillarca granosa]|uniref:Uncharacterized protein n=1 Tax=Tegillarca granosa TaxID=220873 RepID=A0ABQ9EC37_TEGGR|nr:hypothetical protein KUTeg_020444 [Tegillarca granosa]
MHNRGIQEATTHHQDQHLMIMLPLALTTVHHNHRQDKNSTKNTLFE